MLVAILILMVIALILGPQFWVRTVLERYNRQDEANFTGTGGELARHLLDRAGLQRVGVEVTDAGDHYDPLTKMVRLGRDRFDGRTLTAITIAAHEVGHAVQDAAGEPMFRWRTRLAVLAGSVEKAGSLLLFLVPILVLFTRAPSAGLLTLVAAFVIMGIGVLVQLITLPVEFDASFNKALPVLESGYLKPEQFSPARKILRAAALTYVSASLVSLLNFWRWMTLLRK